LATCSGNQAAQICSVREAAAYEVAAHAAHSSTTTNGSMLLLRVAISAATPPPPPPPQLAVLESARELLVAWNKSVFKQKAHREVINGSLWGQGKEDMKLPQLTVTWAKVMVALSKLSQLRTVVGALPTVASEALESHLRRHFCASCYSASNQEPLVPSSILLYHQ